MNGIRDIELVDILAEKAGLKLVHDHEMSINNRQLEWRKEEQNLAVAFQIPCRNYIIRLSPL